MYDGETEYRVHFLVLHIHGAVEFSGEEDISVGLLHVGHMTVLILVPTSDGSEQRLHVQSKNFVSLIWVLLAAVPCCHALFTYSTWYFITPYILN